MEESKFVEISHNLNIQIKCTKQDHQEEDLSIICLKPSCQHKRLMCLKCCLEQHSNHPFLYLNDFLIQCKQNVINVKNMLPNSIRIIGELEETHNSIIKNYKENLINFIEKRMKVKTQQFFERLKEIMNSRADLDAISHAIISIYTSSYKDLGELNANLNFLFNSLKLNDYFGKNSLTSKPISMFNFNFENGFQSLIEKGSVLNNDLSTFLTKITNETKYQIDSIYHMHLIEFQKENREKCYDLLNFKSSQIRYESNLELNKNIIKICSLDSKEEFYNFATISEADETITLWKMDQKKPNINKKLEGHTKPVTDLLFYRENHSLISSSYDKTIKIWDIDSGLLLKTLKKHEDSILSLFLLNDLYIFCSSSSDKTLQFWDIETYESKYNYFIDSKIVKMIYINFEENKYSIVGGCINGYLYWITNAESMKLDLIKKVKAHTSTVNEIFYLNTHKILLTCGNDKSVKIWDIVTKDLAKEIIIKEDTIIPHIHYDVCHDIIITGSTDGFIRIIKVHNYKVIKEFKEDFNEFGAIFWVKEKNALLISGKQKLKNSQDFIYFLKSRYFL